MSKKISELDPVSDLFEGCCFPLVQNGETMKVTYDTFKTQLLDDITPDIETTIDTKIVNKVDKVTGKGLSKNDFTDEYKEKLDEIPDTLYANGADYAEVAIWNDGNPNKENRLHRFVTLKASGRKIAIANSTEQIVGVTSSQAAFVGNARDYEATDTTKAIVGIIGVVSVKTNDNTIKANDRVMSDNNGYAIKSTNNCGYRVLQVLSAGLLEIVVSPNTDMIQRIKDDMTEKQDKLTAGENITIENNVISATGGGTGAVESVNGKTGAVTLNAQDVGALPNNTVIPTKTSQLTNDSGYATTSDLPTKTSDLTNDSNFTTKSYVDGLVGDINSLLTDLNTGEGV